MDVLRLICAEQNRWQDADLERLRALHADLTAQVLPRRPPVLPTRRTDPRHARRKGRAMPAPIGPQKTVRLTRPKCFLCGQPGHYRNKCPHMIAPLDP